MSLPRCSLRGRSGARHARAAARGSAPPIPDAARRARGDARSGRESRLTDRTGKLGLAATDLGGPYLDLTLDVFFLRPPMQFLSGVDNLPLITSSCCPDRL